LKGLSDRIASSLTGRDLKTVLHPKTAIVDEITLATNKDFHLHAYLVNMKKLEFTPNNTILVKLPKRSNIKELDNEMDKIKKGFGCGEKLLSVGDDFTKVSWVDCYNRFFSTKIETPDQVNTVVRGDIANWLFLQRKALIQCATASCDILIPTHVDVDLKKFPAKDPKDQSSKDRRADF